MEENKKNLKITSYVIIILAIVNVVLVGIDFANGTLKANVDQQIEESINQTEGATQEMKDTVTNMALYGTIGATAFGVLFDLYFGIAGLRQANGTSKGKANIILATIVFVLALIGLVTMIGPMTKGQTAVSSFVSSLLGLVIMLFYIIYAKRVVKDAQE